MSIFYKYLAQWFVLVCITLSFITINAQNSSITLQYCETEAINNYPSIKDKELLHAASVLRVQNINALWLPSLSLNGQATYQSDVIDINLQMPNNQLSIKQSHDQYKATVDANQLIFDGGTTKYLRKMEESFQATNIQQVDVDIYKVREQISNVYFMLLMLQESQRLLSTSLGEVSEREKVAESLVKNGVLITSDWDVLKAEKLKIEQQLIDFKFNKKANVNILSILINKPVSDSLEFELPVVEIKDTATSQRPEYKYFELQAMQIDDNKALTYTMRMPKVYAFAQGGYGRPGLNMLSDKFNPFYIFGATLKWTIWDWKKNSRDRQVFDIQKQMINTRHEGFDRNLNIDLQNKIANIKKLEETIKLDSAIVEIRVRVAQSAASRLEQGVITSTDYLTELNATTLATINAKMHKIQFVQAKVNYMLARGY